MKRGWEIDPSLVNATASGSRTRNAGATANPNQLWETQYAQNGGYDPSSFYATDGKRPRMSDTLGAYDILRDDGGMGGDDSEGDEDDDDDDDGSEEAPATSRASGTPKKAKGKGGDGKPKTKLTRGSRACIACRKIKMRCIPDDSNPGGPCKRCRTGGHECTFEESNRGKRSTRKNEALTARLAKMESTLKGIGAALSSLDQPSLAAFSSALHSTAPEPSVIQMITSVTSPSAIPTLAVAMDRNYPPEYGYGGETSHGDGHMAGHPLSPRLHSLPDNVLSPLGLLAEASLQNTDKKVSFATAAAGRGGHRPSPLGANRHMRNGEALKPATSDIGRGGEGDGDEMGGRRGVASHNYFKPSGAVAVAASSEDSKVPGLLSIVTRAEIDELFEIFFTCLVAHVPLIYREFHTPEVVLSRSQFLCTVICAIAARYYTAKPGLHAELSTYAKRLTFEVPSRGYKSVEVVQAYLLLSLWTLGPEKTFEQDRTWMMLGMAIRMATDLNLHRKSMTSEIDTEEGRARDLEIINRERCWLHCFVLDRSLSAQMGKPYTLREDYIIRNACEASWHQHRFSLPADKALAAYVVLQQIMSRAIDSIYSSTATVSGLRQDCDYMLIVRSAHEELRRWLREWNKEAEDPNDIQHEYDARAQFYYAYSTLVLYSFGLENALERAKMDIPFFLTNVYEAATRVCVVVKEQFLPKGYLPYLPDTNFVMCSYALLSLLKLLKPELRPYHDSEEAIFKLVSEMADLLETCAVDPSHQPAIYAAFIREIVRKTQESRRRGPTAPPSRAGSPIDPSLLHETGGDPMLNGGGAGAMLGDPTGVYDPSLLSEQAWSSDLLSGAGVGGGLGVGVGEEGTQFTFIPQGGDMMILPVGASPDVNSSPSALFQKYTNSTPSAAFGATLAGGALGGTPGLGQGPAAGPGPTQWAEYLPTFMSSDGFDGWDGSMLLPGFGRGQITLGGGLLHSGSGLITPAQHTPTQSRSGSRAASRAQTPKSVSPKLGRM